MFSFSSRCPHSIQQTLSLVSGHLQFKVVALIQQNPFFQCEQLSILQRCKQGSFQSVVIPLYYTVGRISSFVYVIGISYARCLQYTETALQYTKTAHNTHVHLLGRAVVRSNIERIYLNDYTCDGYFFFVKIKPQLQSLTQLELFTKRCHQHYHKRMIVCDL